MSDLEKYRKTLDKNNDGLVSLDEYLARETSKGSKAKSGGIDYDYQDFNNIYNYFLITLKSVKKFKILCVPNFTIDFDDYVDRTALVYHVDRNEIIYGKNMKKAIKDCICKKNDKKCKNVRFIFFSLIISFSGNKSNHSTHSNMVLIDLKNKTFERFEPQGSSTDKIAENKPINQKINSKFQNKVMKDLGLKKYSYISPNKISPELGIQAVGDSFCGMCVTISMMYLQMRILNPDVPQKKLVKFIMERPKYKLKEMILKYAKHVEETLKKNKYYVLDLLNEVFEELE